MKYYLVLIEMTIGGFEKHTVKLQRGRTKRAAIRRALANECHNPIGKKDHASAWWEGDYELHDDDGGMIYRLHGDPLVLDNETAAKIKHMF